MANAIKNFIFKMSPGQIIASIIIVGAFLVFLIYQTLSNAVTITNTPLVLILLTVMLLLSRLSIIVKVGIGFLSFILFPVQMIWGPLVSMVMIWSTTFIYCWLAVRPTPLDFIMTKGVSSSLAQGIYLSLWTGAMVALFQLWSVEYIMANLVFVYMISVVIYVVFMVVCLPIFAREPVPIAIVNGIMMIVFQFFLISYVGMSFFQYLMGLP